MRDLCFAIPEIHAAYASGARPQDLVEEVYRRIAAVGDPGIFIHLRPKAEMLAEAAALGAFDPDKPLWGIPFAAKDNIDLSGTPTTAACPAYEYSPSEDAHAIAKLKSAGALCFGKTNLDQFATGLVGVRSPFQVPRNSIDPAMPPGGSSSGSAVSVGHGFMSFALGTDTAGSGRIPAALNNIVGLKPTLGTVSATGLVPACRTLDTISVFALTVEDAVTAYAAMAGYDAADAYSRPFPAPAIAPKPPRFVVGVPTPETREFFGDAVQQASFERTLDRLATLGAELREVDFTPLYRVAEMLYEGAWVAERYAAIEDLISTRPEALHPVTRQIISAAEKLSAADAFKGIYRLADLRRTAEPSLEGLDMLCVPTFPTFYTLADLEADPIGPNSRYGTYTNFVNLLDMSGIAVPVAARSDGRPGSVTLLARAGRDGEIAGVASALMQAEAPTLGATGKALPKVLEATAATPRADETMIAMVGAHMSGLPLNKEVTALGGRFLREAQTAPLYRFYKLAGDPPMRPGLVRVGAGGASIALELWALPTSAVGSFLKGVPSPLGFGTIQLADGATTTGFLCESAGVEGGEDISAHGGWRTFLAAGA